VPVYRTLWRVIVPICLPAIVDIGVYLFVNAMTTVSAVVFLYSADTKLASIAILNLDDASKTGNAAAMGMIRIDGATGCSYNVLYVRLLSPVDIGHRVTVETEHPPGRSASAYAEYDSFEFRVLMFGPPPA